MDVESSWNVMAHVDAREGKWRGNWRMEWVSSTLHITSEHGVSSNTTDDAHTSAASSQLNWRPRRFKWTRQFRRRTKSGFSACAITFQTQSTPVLYCLFGNKFLFTAWFNFSVTTVKLHGSIMGCAEKFVHGSVWLIVNEYGWKCSVYSFTLGPFIFRERASGTNVKSRLGGTEICPGSSGRGQISCTLNFYKSLASLTLTNLLPP